MSTENLVVHDKSPRDDDGKFFVGIGRAFGGALIFSLPMLMTMEMWWLGVYLEPWRIVAMLVLGFPVLLGLFHFGGFRKTAGLADDIADVLVAIVVAATAAGVILFLFGLLNLSMSPREIIGKIAIQLVPASIGAMLARSQLGEQSESEEEEREGPTYWGDLFLMGVGALFLSLNIAPTEEMILIAYKMETWQEIALIALSLTLLHAFIYTLHFRGGSPGDSQSFLSAFARFTFGGYAVVFLVSLGVLWLFGRTQGTSAHDIVSSTVVLSFPGSIGAAAARLIL
ncbi:MAG: TIGR02587 family membrane protein [Pelagibacterium sp.]|uniref:TIGR02587 family membrane protein n=1 Tax=Pelagibacterium sp. TaxID=1967288 RepID=UPI0032ED32F5